MRISVALLLPLMSQAANYSAARVSVSGIEVIRLVDAANRIEVSIAPSIGNMAYEMKVNGKNILWLPVATLAELKKKPALAGIPFLAPFANRLDQDAFWANGRKYNLNPDLGNIRRDGNQKPIHGFLAFSPMWEISDVRSDDTGAWAVSRFEYSKHPDLMAQFPFAHTIEMTYRLKDGVLECETALRNHSAAPMPVAIGYHPYFRLHDASRDDWKVHLAAREHVELSPLLIPTGARKPAAFPDPVPLSGSQLDDVFTNLVRDAAGRSEFWVRGRNERISVVYGPKYAVAVVYAPAGRDFICFEPMAAVTNAFNLAHAGKYAELQSVAPGGQWRESFWIKPSGF
jgi:aldose 1-epimerase